MRAALAGVLLVSALAAAPSAHHTIGAVYDVAHRETLNGVIAAVEWKRPHVIIHVNVTNGDVWDVETQSPINLRQKGLTQDAMKPGTAVTMTVCVARDGSHKGWLHEMMSPTGRAFASVGDC